MPTIGWFEILIIVVIAIIVLGPKDFPIMLKKVGSWIGSAKKQINNIIIFAYIYFIIYVVIIINFIFDETLFIPKHTEQRKSFTLFQIFAIAFNLMG